MLTTAGFVAIEIEVMALADLPLYFGLFKNYGQWGCQNWVVILVYCLSKINKRDRTRSSVRLYFVYYQNGVDLSVGCIWQHLNSFLIFNLPRYVNELDSILFGFGWLARVLARVKATAKDGLVLRAITVEWLVVSLLGHTPCYLFPISLLSCFFDLTAEFFFSSRVNLVCAKHTYVDPLDWWIAVLIGKNNIQILTGKIC